LLEDPSWWGELAWPWPAIELARLEPEPADGLVTAYGRFDWLMDETGEWQLVELNSDTPSGGREVSGLEPAIVALHDEPLTRLEPDLAGRLQRALQARIVGWEAETAHAVRRVGVVSSHGWLEDMAQAWWVARLLAQAGYEPLVGDLGDLAVRDGVVYLRGQRIDALYRFYPIERLYRHGIFAPLMEAVADRRLLLLNGLRGFLAQSKLALAYLWVNRGEPEITLEQRALIERHLPAIVPARHPEAEALLPNSVVKHVNGREGQEVVFGDTLSPADWESRLLEGGYTVQRRVHQQAVEDVEVDEARGTLSVVTPRYACVGGFWIGGDWGGSYTRLGGAITQARSTFVPTLAEAGEAAPAP
jgi:glutathionylspermidine synthase